MKFLALLFLALPCFAQIPNAPVTQPSFFAVRVSYKAPALRTNKQTMSSKVILVTHLAGFAAMAVACSRSSSRENWSSEIPAMVGVSGLDYVSDRYLTRPLALGPMVYAIVHYTKAAIK